MTLHAGTSPYVGAWIPSVETVDSVGLVLKSDFCFLEVVKYLPQLLAHWKNPRSTYRGILLRRRQDNVRKSAREVVSCWVLGARC